MLTPQLIQENRMVMTAQLEVTPAGFPRISPTPYTGLNPTLAREVVS
jgi:hypothetical protein